MKTKAHWYDRLYCRLFGHDLFSMKTAFMCRRCFCWWKKYAPVEVTK